MYEHPVLKGLTAEQRAAVMTVSGPLFVLSGAGSGKTRVICNRFAWLMVKKVAAKSILTLTFTNKAAEEMGRRIRGIMYELRKKSSDDLRQTDLAIGTFHSICARVLRADGRHIGLDQRFAIWSDDRTATVVRQILADLGIGERKTEQYVDGISRVKDGMGASNVLRLQEVMDLYEKRRREARALDFGDLLSETIRLFQNSEILEKYRALWPQVMVDECQDTNASQYEIVRLLTAESRNLCMVGDSDQSIYSWRGARRENLDQFLKDYPEAKQVELLRNYRSTRPILTAAENLINHNLRTREKRLVTDREDGPRPAVIRAADEEGEALRVVAGIMELVRRGEKRSSCAVLYRTAACGKLIEETLKANEVACRRLRRDGDRPEEDEVVLSTVHAAKGLEFKNVWIVGLAEGVFPHQKAGNGRDVEEERRLAYVAMTRAKDRLTLSWPDARQTREGFAPCRPSRFLWESGVLEVQA